MRSLLSNPLSRNMISSLVVLGAAVQAAAPAMAQQVNQLDCQGQSQSGPAIVSGMRQFTASNALGDGYVRFQGQYQAGALAGQMVYEGYTQTAPFEGYVTTQDGAVSAIAVLDNTGGRMVVYSGTPSLGAPDILAELVCNWR